jgi:hypothetical protein
MAFPPAKGSGSPKNVNLPGNDQGNPVSTGSGGIPASLKIKAAGTKNSPGVERDVNLS